MKKEIKQHINDTKASDIEQFQELVDQGEIIKEKMDTRGQYLAFELPGVTYISAPLKTFERAKEKVEADYIDKDGNPDYSRLTDVTRCSFVCDTYEQMLEVHKIINKTLDVRQEKDTMEIPNEKTAFRNKNMLVGLGASVREKDLGLRNLRLLVGINGHISEIQIHLKCIYDVAQDEHLIYEEKRSLEAQIKKGKKAITDEQMDKLTELKRLSIDIYDNAISKYNDNTLGKKIKLYREFFGNDTPSRQEVKKTNVIKLNFPGMGI